MVTTTSVDAHGPTAGSVSPTALIRWSGIGTVLTGVLLALFPFLHPNHDEAGYASAAWIPVHVLPNLGMLLLLFGLIGLLARQLHRAGRLGVIGFAVAFAGTAMLLTGAQLELFIFPFVGLNAPQLMRGGPPRGMIEMQMLTGLVFLVGYVALGVATVRAGVLPRGVGVLLAVGSAAFVASTFLGGALPPALRPPFWVGPGIFGVALVWLGWGLWTGPGPERAGLLDESAAAGAPAQLLVNG